MRCAVMQYYHVESPHGGGLQAGEELRTGNMAVFLIDLPPLWVCPWFLTAASLPAIVHTTLTHTANNCLCTGAESVSMVNKSRNSNLHLNQITAT